MNVTHESLAKVDQHWAVQAVGENERKRGLDLANVRLVNKAIGEQLTLNVATPRHGDDDLLSRLALAYEMAAIEGLEAFLNSTSGDKALSEQCAAGAWRAFEIGRMVPPPQGTERRVLHLLHLSSLAYCGDRWTDLRRWYHDEPELCAVPSVADAPWDKRLLYRLFECWIRLFRKQDWDDLDRIREIIVGLREDQKDFEAAVLKVDTDAGNRAMALRLVTMYHWAKASELLAKFMLQGDPTGINALLTKHFDTAIKSATEATDSQLELLMRWLHAASTQMVAGSIWRVARAVNSRVTKFVHEVTKQQGLFELLPPQRAAWLEQGLLDQAATAVVIDMPTSGGKTLLAQFRILQALNQFDAEHGWVAYVAPTRALAAQITRRLRRDFSPIGVKVEALTGAVEVDAFEDELLKQTGDKRAFDVLISTPEKLQLVIRNKKVPRPLALVVMDEAHNIENESRGMRMELLLATIKQECAKANFLLLMPFVEKAEKLARWLADDAKAGRAISLGTTAWKPNERIVGIYHAEADDSQRAGWRMRFETLTTTPKAMHLKGVHHADGVKPLDVARSKVISNNVQCGFGIQTAAMAKIFSARGSSVAVATQIPHVWTMAREAAKAMPATRVNPPEITLVQNYLKAEISPKFELIDLLNHGVGVHHAGLSDEARTLMEWLTEEGLIKVLCATTTIAQGINFPVSSVFLASHLYPYGKPMAPREFWNLAGRAGRMNQDSVGVVGLAGGTEPKEIVKYVSQATGELVSRLLALADELKESAVELNLQIVVAGEQWEDFRCYVAHLINEKKNLDAVLASTENLLRNTYGYDVLKNSPGGREKADKLLAVTKAYATKLAQNPGQAALADMTGFSCEGVAFALAGMNNLERRLTPADWTAEGLFGRSSGMADLFGVMLRIPQIRHGLEDITGPGIDKTQIAAITKAWVGGESIHEIAKKFFKGTDGGTDAITDTCKAIYKTLVNNGTWGIAALSKFSGIDFEKLTAAERRKINALPAMIYHGVKTEAGVLMRMNSVPRSVAEKLGEVFEKKVGTVAEGQGVQAARGFLKTLDAGGWEAVKPAHAPLSGADYRRVWELLSGESR
jgi:superfamily II DNA/RNA helicase